ncbi:hypothetical protein [Novosphingobium sp. BL-8A]|uniref:hypothetical protein n=1 Tax=Novosphingobium sp. BL-8A TaxID=3127639 RepID=UPI003756DD8A
MDQAPTRFQKGAETAARKDNMNYLNTGAAKLSPISLRKSSADTGSMERHSTFSAMLSTLELRRLVAAMVD